jgi:hypothetical protein
VSMTTPADNAMVNQTEPRPTRVRISVRALMLAVLVLAVGLGFYVRSVHVQQDAVAAIRRAGGTVDYDWRWGNYNPDIIDDDGKWRAPKWLARLVPVDYVANVVDVSLMPTTPNSPNKANDETLALVGRLRHVASLRLNDTAMTDAGMAHIEGLTGLRSLQLNGISVGDAGLAHLRGMKILTFLWISGTRVTDEGVLDLERAIPALYICRSEEMVSSDKIPRAIADLDYARSRPVRLASALLVHRAKSMAGNRNEREFIATVDALCDLEAHDKLSLINLAKARAECIGILGPSYSPSLDASERRRLQQRCADRGIDALTQAVDLGYDNVRHLEAGPGGLLILWNLQNHPAFPKLIQAMKARRPDP